MIEKKDDLKLSSPNDFLSFLRMDEGTHEELLNLVGRNFKNKMLKCVSIVARFYDLSLF